MMVCDATQATELFVSYGSWKIVMSVLAGGWSWGQTCGLGICGRLRAASPTSSPARWLGSGRHPVPTGLPSPWERGLGLGMPRSWSPLRLANVPARLAASRSAGTAAAGTEVLGLGDWWSVPGMPLFWTVPPSRNCCGGLGGAVVTVRSARGSGRFTTTAAPGSTAAIAGAATAAMRLLRPMGLLRLMGFGPTLCLIGLGPALF